MSIQYLLVSVFQNTSCNEKLFEEGRVEIKPGIGECQRNIQIIHDF